MRHFIKTVIFSLFIILLTGCNQQSTQPKIGVIVPIEHPAMKEIVSGLTNTLQDLHKQPLKFKVANAQGDMNLQRSIIQQMRDENYTLIIAIGTTATQMSASMVKLQPLIGLAAKFSDNDRALLNPCNIAIVDDEISPEQSLTFMHKAFPDITNIAVIHSSSEKVFPEIKTVEKFARQNSMNVKSIMVSSLPELYTAGKAIPENTQAIFILKDNLIVSGISTLVQIAKARHIPLITSDQASVENGAGFALGVHEKQIGEEGAKLAEEILSGKPACSLPITEMTKLSVFINSVALKDSNRSEQSIEQIATQLHYNVEKS